MKLALQLFTVRHMVKQNLLGTLCHVGNVGYRWVETCKLPIRADTAQVFRQAYESYGIRLLSALVSYSEIHRNFSKHVDFLHKTGCSVAVVAMLPIPIMLDGSRQAMQQFCERLNQLGRQCAEEDIRLCFHHHSFEFSRFGDRLGIHILLNELGEYVDFVCDCYWSQRVGISPESLIPQFKGRVRGIHLRDMEIVRKGFCFHGRNCPLGHGTADIPDILKAAELAGAEYAAVEQNSRNPLTDISESYQYATQFYKGWV